MPGTWPCPQQSHTMMLPMRLILKLLDFFRLAERFTRPRSFSSDMVLSLGGSLRANRIEFIFFLSSSQLKSGNELFARVQCSLTCIFTARDSAGFKYPLMIFMTRALPVYIACAV